MKEKLSHIANHSQTKSRVCFAKKPSSDARFGSIGMEMGVSWCEWYSGRWVYRVMPELVGHTYPIGQMLRRRRLKLAGYGLRSNAA